MDSKQDVLQCIARSTIGDMPPIPFGRGEVSPENDLAVAVRGRQVIQQRIDFASFREFGLDLIDLRERAHYAALRRHLCGSRG